MKTLEMSQAKEKLSDYVPAARKEPMVLTRHGRPFMALVSLENVDSETVRLSTDRRFLQLIERSRSRYRSHGGISAQEMRLRLWAKKKAKK